MEVIECLLQLICSCQNKRAIVSNRLFDWLSREENEASIGFQCGYLDIFLHILVYSKWNCTWGLYRSSTLNGDLTLVEHDQTVPTSWNRVSVGLVSIIDDKINEPGWRACNDRSADAEDIT